MSVNLFDANFYRAANPDLAELNNSQAFSHFQNFGLNQGREFSPLVNLNFYRSSNSDLANFNNQQTYDHLRNHGVAEGRRFSPFVDLNFYQDANSDLATFNNEKVFKHLRDYGVAEGRGFSPFVDLNFYRAANSDLASFNNKQALQHLEIHGLNEGRDFSFPFDLNYYRERNSDLVAAGLNNSQLLQHFELHGLNEGRASSPDYNVSYYLFNNSDLVAAGFNYNQAYEHYALYGYNEGRLGVAPPIQQWIQEIGGGQEVGAGTGASSEDVTIDSSGNVYIIGTTFASLAGTNAGETDVWLAKYDNSGNRLWLQQFGTINDDSPVEIKVDSFANVYITGITNASVPIPNTEDTDSWLAKYDSSGNRQWIQQFDISTFDYSHELEIDNSGNVYIAGSSAAPLAGSSDGVVPGDFDGWVLKYDSSGNRQWIKQFSTPGQDSASVAVDSTDNIYITENTVGNIGDPRRGKLYHNALLTKYDSSGNRLWIQKSSNSYYLEVEVDNVGNIYISGQGNNYNSLLAKYDTSGKRLWTQSQAGQYEYGMDLAVDNSGSFYMLRDSGNGRSTRTSVIKYDGSSGYSLGIQYSITRPVFSSPTTGLAVDNASNFYLTGRVVKFVGETLTTVGWVAKFSKPLNVV